MTYKGVALLVALVLLPFATSSSCGRPIIGQGNIIGGTRIPPNIFPWNVALVQQSGDFFCGGTVISDIKILTAAHCIHDKVHKFRPGDIKIYLGVHNLSDSTEFGRSVQPVNKIHIHPDWNPQSQSFDADIAILELVYEVSFNRFVQPICLDFDSKISSIKNGIIIGYGLADAYGTKAEDLPSILEAPIHEENVCFSTNPELWRISSKRTFCGGPGGGRGVCTGDSGSGFYVQHGGVYYLRGIVSSSLFTFGKACDVNTFSVFTNVLLFKNWILNGKPDPPPGQETTERVEDTRLDEDGVWVPWDGSKHDVPKYAVIGGHDSRGRTIYVARAEHFDSGTQVGRYVTEDDAAFYSYGSKGYKNSLFEILTHKRAFWENKTGTRNILIPGGNGQYVCRVHYRGEVIPGKLHFGRCNIQYGSDEKALTDWDTLKRTP